MKQNITPKSLGKVTVLYNETDELPHTDKTALLTVEGAEEDALIIKEALIEQGFSADIFNLNKKTVKSLSEVDSDIFFNLCDGIGNLPHTEEKVPEMLDEMKLAYTGANKQAIIVTTNKIKTKKIFQENGIPTPNFFVATSENFEIPKDVKFPLIVKPSAQDCSIGLGMSSVVNNVDELKKEVEKVYKTYKESVLIEEFIDHRELNLTVIGNDENIEVLPISEIIFGNSFNNNAMPKIIDFDAKWTESSNVYKDTNGVCPADIPQWLEKKINEYAIRAYKAVGARDYARIDIRLDKELTPYFLEVNVNPDLYPGMGASRAAKTHGWTYSEFIAKITSIAAKRCELIS